MLIELDSPVLTAVKILTRTSVRLFVSDIMSRGVVDQSVQVSGLEQLQRRVWVRWLVFVQPRLVSNPDRSPLVYIRWRGQMRGRPRMSPAPTHAPLARE